jgi:cytoskeletal protein CcmA (bactofilin family)
MKIFKKLSDRIKKNTLFIFAFVLVPLLLFCISPALSINAIAEKQITITANQVIDDDLYLSGEILTIDGTIKGDAVLSGKQITVNGTVDGDLIAAGQTININGTIKDDVRIAGQVLTIDSKAKITDDLIAAGASLENKAGSSVGGDVNFFGAQALLAGTINKSVLGAINSLELRGSVGQNMRVTAIGDPNPLKVPFIPKPDVAIPEIPEGLSILDTAKIGGKLTYKSTKDAQINQKAQVIGGIVREELPYKGQQESGWNGFIQAQTPGEIFLQQLQRLVALLLIGWLLLRFVPGWTQGLTTTIQTKPLPSLGWGLVTFIGIWVVITVVPIITVLLSGLLAFTLPNLILPVVGIGTLFAIFLSVGFAIFATFVPQILIGFLSGKWLMQRLRPNKSTGRIMSLFAGLVVFVLLSAIPILGGIFELIITLMGLGAIWLWRERGMHDIRHQNLMPA